MRIGVIPTKYGSSAVVLPPFEGDWEIYTPAPLKHDVLVQLQSQILQRLAGYCQSLMPWTGTLITAIPWGLWSIAALAFSSIWSYGLKYAVLYGWIRFFFFGDGLFHLTQTLIHLPELRRAKQIRRNLAKGKWAYAGRMPYRVYKVGSIMSEREYINTVREAFPETEPYYKEMLRKEPPQVHRMFPLGLSGWIKRLFLGPKIPLPSLCFELGEDPFDVSVEGKCIPQTAARPLGYVIDKVLWFPEPRFAWGELEGLEDGVRVLSPGDVDTKKIPMFCHDNVFRPTIRISAGRRLYFLGRLMLWGVIWLVGMDRPIEDVIGGLYLFLGLPAFLQLYLRGINGHISKCLDRFKACFYSPKVDIVYSQRLSQLGELPKADQLQSLDEWGFGHLREFFRRVAWQRRWKVSPPTGQGVLDVKT